jgi:hypothetical protein
MSSLGFPRPRPSPESPRRRGLPLVSQVVPGARWAHRVFLHAAAAAFGAGAFPPHP